MHVFADPTNLGAYLSGFLWILKLTGASAVLAREANAAAAEARATRHGGEDLKGGR